MFQAMLLAAIGLFAAIAPKRFAARRFALPALGRGDTRPFSLNSNLHRLSNLIERFQRFRYHVRSLAETPFAVLLCRPGNGGPPLLHGEQRSMGIIARDAVLHFVHFLCIFALASMLVGELLLFRRTLPRDVLRRLALVDRWYGITAGLVILSGLSLLFFGAKGYQFYVHNPVFWTKMGLFVAVALLSIPPTIDYLRWSGTGDGPLELNDAQYARVSTLLWIQVGLFIFIPLCAALMADGI